MVVPPVLTPPPPAPWHLLRITQRENPNLDLPTVTHSPYPAHGTRLFLLDTGVDKNNPEIAKNIRRVVSFVPTEDGVDLNGHGTHIAGVMVGATNGVAQNATLNSYKVLDKDGMGELSWTLQALGSIATQASNAIKNGTMTKPWIISLSVSSGAVDTLADPITMLYKYNVLVTIGASYVFQDVCNRPSDPSTKVLFKSSAHGPCIDLLAPGVDISSINLTGGLTTKSGSSIASAIAASVAAIAVAERNYTTVDSVITALKETATRIDRSLIPADTSNLLVYSLF
ncbi:peptidase S8/S53 domain-containing protein [Syncephalis fuscata]|nr:peptidase S8/S53 domain-containing protein [Syncephalis fuscata]